VCVKVCPVIPYNTYLHSVPQFARSRNCKLQQNVHKMNRNIK